MKMFKWKQQWYETDILDNKVLRILKKVGRNCLRQKFYTANFSTGKKSWRGIMHGKMFMADVQEALYDIV